jgi:rhodanese-related sulfurtransferase
MSLQQLSHYNEKLSYETDSWDLYLALSRGEKIMVVDGRGADAYARERIPGSINIPHRTISQDSLAKLDKTMMYIAYCDGIGCNASTKTALKMLTLGFQVKELVGGLDWWKRDGYATEGENGQAGTMSSCGCE